MHKKIAFAIGLIFIIIFGGCVSTTQKAPASSTPSEKKTPTSTVVNKVKFESANTCRQCHESIYKDWSKSMHVQAREAWYYSHKVASDRTKMACYNEENKSVKCEQCHEPAGFYPMGAYMQEKGPALAAVEGVTCDVCHRITEVNSTGEFSFGPKNIKLGPYQNSKSPYHQTAYSSVIQTSEFCVACHGQLSNKNGLIICDTVQKWRESKYSKEGKTCQDCHMPVETGSAADGKAAPSDVPKERSLHRHVFRGPHNDPTLLREAATLNLNVKVTENGILRVTVNVTNSGTGHDMPSGLPERTIALKVVAKDDGGKVIWQNWREDAYKEDRLAAFGIYGFNPKGKPVPPMGAAKIDNLKLMPGETRSLKYEIQKDEAGKIRLVEARLMYYLARPDGITYFGNQQNPTITQPKVMASIEREVLYGAENH